MGELNPAIAKSYKITQPLIICEVEIAELEKVKVPEKLFKEISKYPAVYRDANFEVSNNVTHELIAKTIKDTGGVILEYFNLVDIYIDDKLKMDNKKSMTYEFIFQDRSRTLEDKEVDDVFQKIIKNVNKVTGGTLRGA
jgi:phenylalanyl-tRNA synthetase beta chain